MSDVNTLCRVIRNGKRKAEPVPFLEIRPGDKFFCRGQPIEVGRVKELGCSPYRNDLLLETVDGNSLYGVDELDKAESAEIQNTS